MADVLTKRRDAHSGWYFRGDQPGKVAIGQHSPDGSHTLPGFSLLEMMMVLTLILLAATITQPIYQNMILRAREAALRDTLFTMRSMIDRFTLDNKRPPASLEEMVEAGYLGDIPIDPITRSNSTWFVETEDFPLSGGESILGLVNVHSGSDQTSLDGTPYSSW
jgi:general secretion pathway protein G